MIFGTVKAKDGRPVMCVLDLAPVENHILINDMQKLDSAYTKDNKPVEFVTKSDVLYISENKKRTKSLLGSTGFQMPIKVQQNGSVGRISYRKQDVNISGIPFPSVVSIEDSNDIRYSINDIDNYTEEEYNDYGWVSVNDVLSGVEYTKLNEQFAAIQHNKGRNFETTADGYYVIPVGFENKPQNNFVFIKGTIKNPLISEIMHIDVQNEMELDEIRGRFNGSRAFQTRTFIEDLYGEETVVHYRMSDFENYKTLQNERQATSLRRNAGSNQGLSNRNRSGGSGKSTLWDPYKKFSINESEAKQRIDDLSVTVEEQQKILMMFYQE